MSSTERPAIFTSCSAVIDHVAERAWDAIKDKPLSWEDHILVALTMAVYALDAAATAAREESERTSGPEMRDAMAYVQEHIAPLRVEIADLAGLREADGIPDIFHAGLEDDKGDI